MTTTPHFLQRDGAYCLVGAIDFNTAPTWLRLSESLFTTSASQSLILNFAALESSNSAGLALVIEWLNLAARNKIKLRFTDFPPSLLSIAKVSGVIDLIQDCL